MSDEQQRIIGTCSRCDRWITSDQAWGEYTTPYNSAITGLVIVARYHKGECPD